MLRNYNMEKLNCEKMLFIGWLRNFQFEKFKSILKKKEIRFSAESYGLEWLGKSYARLLASDEATTLLREVEEHNQKPENRQAENLHELAESVKHFNNKKNLNIDFIIRY
jgi:hypothetical protein